MTADFYNDLNIPLPSKSVAMSETVTPTALYAQIDTYFDDIIRNYPENTQTFLKEMYYDDTNVIPVNCFAEGLQANWHVNGTAKGIQLTMSLDQGLQQSPLITKLNKIHEIAGHLGQIHQRLHQIGVTKWVNEAGADFNKFLEQSIAPAEKYIIDRIPETVFAREIALIPKSHQKGITEDFRIAKEISRTAYAKLQHRKHLDGSAPEHVSTEDHKRLHNRPLLRTFNKWAQKQDKRQKNRKSQPKPPRFS